MFWAARALHWRCQRVSPSPRGVGNLLIWLIDSCQNSVSADQYRLTVSRAQVSTPWVRVIFRRYSLTSCYFSNDRRLKFNFFLNAYEISRVSWAALLKCWFRADLGHEIHRLLHLHVGKAIAFDFSHCHALITLYVQFVWSDWSKFDRWVYAENFCSVWKLAYW